MRWPHFLLAIIVALFAGALAWRLPDPYVRDIDFNAAVWSQAAHIFLRDGMGATAGVPAPFYFGPPPVPQERLYAHHPPLLAVVITAAFALLGESEWVARLIPFVASLAGVILLWRLVSKCADAPSALFAAAVCVALPMQLYYGTMVNFEPVAQTLFLAMLVCMTPDAPPRRRAAGALLFAALCLTWFAHIYAIVLTLWSFARRRAKEGAVITALASVSAALFIGLAALAWGGAPDDILEAFVRRTGAGQTACVWTRWAAAMAVHLGRLTPWPFWTLAAAGGWVVWRERGDVRLRWLSLAALGLFVTDCAYVVIFRNASAIHSYASFYFIVPLAVFGGIGLGRAWRAARSPAWRAAPVLAVITLLGWGNYIAVRKDPQFMILGKGGEPRELIPALGQVIREHFPPETLVLLNFEPDYGPQLSYYAQREIANGLTAPEHWLAFMGTRAESIGGVIARDAARGEALLRSLPPGYRTERLVLGERFVLWRRAESGE